MTDRPRPWLIVGFAAATLVSEFLVFQVQPVISKTVLPWFGGSPAVWTTCMLFFQVLLFVGYAYAHLITRWLTPRLQGVIHFSLLALALLVLPITPAASWKPTGSEPQRPIAHKQFSFLDDSQAEVEIVLGDARISLEREPDQNFDVLILDAFSSDAIPTHLLTREAFDIYERHLKPEALSRCT